MSELVYHIADCRSRAWVARFETDDEEEGGSGTGRKYKGTSSQRCSSASTLPHSKRGWQMESWGSEQLVDIIYPTIHVTLHGWVLVTAFAHLGSPNLPGATLDKAGPDSSGKWSAGYLHTDRDRGAKLLHAAKALNVSSKLHARCIHT